MSELFASGGQSTGVSALASFLPKKPRSDLLQNGLVGSPCSPRNSQETSPAPQFKSINSSALSFLHNPTLTSIHDHRKTIALTRQTFIGRVMSLLFNTNGDPRCPPHDAFRATLYMHVLHYGDILCLSISVSPS